jgi:hypothetical protein
MRGMFGAGFTSPKGIKREVPEGERYLNEFTQSTGKSIDGRLLLEDPDKYTEMFKENISLLKESVKKQQDQILGGESVGNNNGLLADHIKKTEKNFRDVASQSQSMADKCISQYDAAVKAANQQLAQQQKDFAKQQSELGEKNLDFCRRFSLAASNHPGPACDGNVGDLVKSVGTTANKFAAYCDQHQSQKESGSSESAGVKATSLCSSYPDQLKSSCENLKRCDRKVITPTGNSTAVGTFEPCTDVQTQAAYNNVIAAANKIDEIRNSSSKNLIVINSEDAPAFCTAGNNSGREDSPKGWMGALDTFHSEFRKQMGTTGQ